MPNFDMRTGANHSFKYKLLPVFANFPVADVMGALITKVRSPFAARLGKQLAVPRGTLFHRGNFRGTYEQPIVSALIEVKGANMAVSSGYRWGTSQLPNSPILMEDLIDQTATICSYSTLTDWRHHQNHHRWRCRQPFQSRSGCQQGGDMVRVRGMICAMGLKADVASRVQDMRVDGKPTNTDKKYKVAGREPGIEGAKGKLVWDVVAQ